MAPPIRNLLPLNGVEESHVGRLRKLFNVFTHVHADLTDGQKDFEKRFSPTYAGNITVMLVKVSCSMTSLISDDFQSLTIAAASWAWPEITYHLVF
jgi:hypothetical protein